MLCCTYMYMYRYPHFIMSMMTTYAPNDRTTNPVAASNTCR